MSEYTETQIASESGEVNRVLRPGLAALRVAGYPAVQFVRRGEMLILNIFPPSIVINQLYHP